MLGWKQIIKIIKYLQIWGSLWTKSNHHLGITIKNIDIQNLEDQNVRLNVN